MRKFYLEADGTRWGLNRENGIMFVNVTGLGSSAENTYEAIGKDGFYALTDKQYSQGQVVGDLVFCGADPYGSCRSFADSVYTAGKLVLIYDCSGTEYRADVDLAYLTRTELQSGSYLSCPTAFNMRSLWYTETMLTGTDSVSVTAGGQYDTAVIVRSAGAMIAPSLTISSGSEVIASVSVYGQTTGPLEYSNVPDDCHLTDDSGDILSMTSANDEIFGRTRNAFTVSLDGGMTVKVRKYWRIT